MSDRSKRKTAEQPPVSAHPAFPVIVALWFAALCGIGSMILPLEMFERLAVASGLADAYSAAQPPLGATARMVVAALAALIGAAAGVFVAMRVRAAHAPRSVGRRAAALQPAADESGAAKRPISAHEELFEGGLDGDEPGSFGRAAPAGRRRALAVTDDSAPSDFLAFAPLPGRSANESDEPLDLVAFEEPTTVDPAPALDEVETPAALRFEPAPQEFGTSVLSAAEPRPFDRAPADPDAPSAPQLHPAESHPAETAPAPATPAPAVPVGARALGELGVVELVERFALALQRHQAAAASSAANPSPEAAAEIAPEAGETTASMAPEVVELAPTALPDALRPFAFDEAESELEDSAEALPDLELSVPRVPFSAPFAAALGGGFDDDEEQDAELADDDGYPSLLAMKSPPGHRAPVRIDDHDDAGQDPEAAEPVVVFPGQAIRRAAQLPEATARPFDAPLHRAENLAAAARHPAADPGATERALRDALEKLQRMSGAA